MCARHSTDTVSTVSPSISYEVMGPDAMIFVFWLLSFKPTFSFSSFTFIKRLFNSSSLSAIRVISAAYLWLLIFFPAIFHTYWRFFSIFGFPLWKQIYRKPVILMQRHRDIPALSNLNGDHDIATRFLKIDFSCPDLSLHRKWRRTKEPLDESGRREWKSWLKTQPSEN